MKRLSGTNFSSENNLHRIHPSKTKPTEHKVGRVVNVYSKTVEVALYAAIIAHENPY